MKYTINIVLLIISTFAFGLQAGGQPAGRTDPKKWQEACSSVQRGRLDQALEQFRAALGRKPEAPALLQAGAMLAKQSGAKQAEELYRWGRKRLGQPDAFADRLAELYQSQLQYQPAVEEWLKLLPKQPGLVRAKLEEIGVQAGYGTVAGMAEPGLKKDDDAGWLLVGSLYLRDRNWQRAWDAFGSARNTATVRAGLAQLMQAPGAPEIQIISALEEYRSRSGDRSPELTIRLGELYRKARQFDRAEETYRQLPPPQGRLAAVLLAQTALDRGDAAGLFRALGQPGPGPAWPDSLRARVQLLRARGRILEGNLEEAKRTYSILYSDSTISVPNRQLALFERAEAELMAGQADQALADYRQAVKLGMGGEPANDALMRIVLISEAKAGKMEALGLWARGLYARARQDGAQALSLFQEAAAKSAGTSLADQSYLGMADIQLEQGQARQAAETFGKLAEVTADSAMACQAIYRQGLALRYRLDRPGQAAEVWRQGVVRYPNYSWSDLMRQELEGIKE